MARFDIDAFLKRGKEQGRALIVEDFLDVDRMKNSKIGWLAGRGRIIEMPLKSLGATVKNAGQHVQSAAARAFRKDIAEPLPTDSDDAAERFEVAQQVYERDNADVALDQDTLHRAFLFYMAGFFGILAMAICSWDAYATGLPWYLDLPARFAVLPVALVLAMKAAFYNWQIRTRRLGGLGEFLRNPSQWWPEPPPGGDSGMMARSAPAMLVLLACGALCVTMIGAPSPAMAQQAGGAASGSSGGMAALLTVPTSGTDLWFNMLQMVFPGVGPLGGTANTLNTGIANGFAAMLAALMTIASAMLTYQTVVGVAATAHEGQVLGKRWNMMFAPLRVCYGFGTLAPAIKGYCVLQVVIIYIAVASGSVGNAIWSSFVTGLSGFGVDSSPPPSPKSMDLVSKDMLMEICYAALQNVPTTANQYANSTPKINAPAAVSRQDVGGHMIGARSVVDAWNSMTSYITSSPTPPKAQATPVSVWDYGKCGKLTANFTASAGDSNAQALYTAQLSAIDTLRGSLAGIATQIVKAASAGGGVDIATVLTDTNYTNIMSAKGTYDQSVMAAANTYLTGVQKVISPDTFKTNATQAGWASAGAYYMTIARITAMSHTLINEQPTVDGGSADGDFNADPSLSSFLAPVIAQYQGWWEQERGTKTVSFTGTAPNGDPIPPESARAGTARSGWNDLFSSDSAFSRLLLSQVVVSPGQGTALQQLVDFGNYILDMAWSAIGVYIGANILSSVMTKFVPGIGLATKAVGGVMSKAGDVTGLSGLGGAAGTFLMLCVVSLLIVGALHAFVLPMMPFIHFSFAILGTLVTVIEGVIAAPLLAFVHVRLDGGDDFIDQKQSPGYQMAFSVFTRIPLTLFGLIFSLIVFETMMWFMGKTLFVAMASATAGATFGPVGIMTYLILISVVNYQMATRSFAMITQVPDRVCEWFGVRGTGSGNEHQNATAAMGAVLSHTQSGMGNATQALQSGMGVNLGQRPVGPQPRNKGGKGGGGGGGSVEQSGATDAAAPPAGPEASNEAPSSTQNAAVDATTEVTMDAAAPEVAAIPGAKPLAQKAARAAAAEVIKPS